MQNAANGKKDKLAYNIPYAKLRAYVVTCNCKRTPAKPFSLKLSVSAKCA